MSHRGADCWQVISLSVRSCISGVNGISQGSSLSLSYNASGCIDMPRERVDGYHVCALLVPWGVFLPVGRRDVFPVIVKMRRA